MLYSKGNSYYYKEENLKKKAFRYIGKDCAYMLFFYYMLTLLSYVNTHLLLAYTLNITSVEPYVSQLLAIIRD